MGLFQKVARRVASIPSSMVVNKVIRRYGQVLKLTIDPQKGTVAASILLKGEDRPIEIRDLAYRVVDSPEGKEIEIIAVTCDREWVHAAATQFLIGKRFAIPAPIAWGLNLIS